MQKVIAALIFSFLFSSSTIGQQQISIGSNSESATQFILKRELKLENYDKPEEVEMEIHEGTDRFELMIRSEVTSGKLTIEIYNPEGQKKGVFSVGSSLNSTIKEKSSGKIMKSLQEPESGIWKVRLIPVNALGLVRIDLKTSYND